MRAFVLTVLGLLVLPAMGVQAESGASPDPGRAGDAGAERVLSRLRHHHMVDSWRDAVQAGAPVSAARSDPRGETAPDVDRRGSGVVTTQPFGAPSVLIRDGGRRALLWEGQLRIGEGRRWGVELTSIRDADPFDPASVGMRMF